MFLSERMQQQNKKNDQQKKDQRNRLFQEDDEVGMAYDTYRPFYDINSTKSVFDQPDEDSINTAKSVFDRTAIFHTGGNA